MPVSLGQIYETIIDSAAYWLCLLIFLLLLLPRVASFNGDDYGRNTGAVSCEQLQLFIGADCDSTTYNCNPSHYMRGS